MKYNKKIIEENGNTINEDVIYFKYKGHDIWNPLMDETLRFSVNPLDKYGEKNINKFIIKYKNS